MTWKCLFFQPRCPMAEEKGRKKERKNDNTV
jgi:hypothetical protein